MQAHLDLRLEEIRWEEIEKEKKGIRAYVKRGWNTVTRYIKYDKDAIFKDPNWPHIWS